MVVGRGGIGENFCIGAFGSRASVVFFSLLVLGLVQMDCGRVWVGGVYHDWYPTFIS